MTVATIDRRGYLEDPLTPLHWESEFTDLAVVAESLGSAVDVFGHSAGALTVIGAAPTIPNLRRLALYEPPFRPQDAPPPGEAQIAVAQRMRSLLEADDVEGLFDTWFTELAGPSLPDPEAWQAVRDQFIPYTRSLVRELGSDRSVVGPNHLDGLAAATCL